MLEQADLVARGALIQAPCALGVEDRLRHPDLRVECGDPRVVAVVLPEVLGGVVVALLDRRRGELLLGRAERGVILLGLIERGRENVDLGDARVVAVHSGPVEEKPPCLDVVGSGCSPAPLHDRSSTGWGAGITWSSLPSAGMIAVPIAKNSITWLPHPCERS